jgi:hypothetical protein
MINGSRTLVAVRRRQQPNLLKVLEGLQDAPKSATPALQMLLAKLASLEQQLNSMVVVRPNPMQPQAGTSIQVQPEKLTNIFD